MEIKEKIENGKMENEQPIKRFLKILAEKDTDALAIFLQNKGFRSDSVAEEKFNDSVEEFYKSLEQDPSELTIKEFLQFYDIEPISQKTKYLQDYYISAEQAMSKYFEKYSFYKHLYHLQEIINQVHLLHRKALCRRGWKTEKERNDIIATLEKDSDVAILTLKIGEEEYEHPYYIRTGCKRENISLNLSCQKGINEGEWRISVIVDSPTHILTTDLEICKDKINFQPWRRDNRYIEDNLDYPLERAWKLPLIGTTVRQGDVVYCAHDEITHFDFNTTLPEGFIPFTYAYRKVSKSEVIIEHPDHLPAKVLKPDWGEKGGKKRTWYICAKKVSGQTDYRPSEGGD